MEFPLKLSLFSKQDMATPLNFSSLFSGSSFATIATPSWSIVTGILGSVFMVLPFFFPTNFKEIPGPRGLPIFGNLFDWPSEFQAERIDEWKEKYGTYIFLASIIMFSCISIIFTGSMIKLSVFGKTAIFLTTGRTITEIFAKRASDFSDRPRLIFSQELYVSNIPVLFSAQTTVQG